MENQNSSEFTPDEEKILLRYFTNVDKNVFGLINLPEVVKGALFARYSRSEKSLRRIFLDEFYSTIENISSSHFNNGENIINSQKLLNVERAEKLYSRVLSNYGDDSIAQLGTAHVAIENLSNIATKVIERPRLAAYLEQSTRYVRLDQLINGRYKFATPPELHNSQLLVEYEENMKMLFSVYKKTLEAVLENIVKDSEKELVGTYKLKKEKIKSLGTLTAQACDIARGILPAATLSNVGILATAQTYELMLMKFRVHPLDEIRKIGESLKKELEKILPAFLERLDKPDRGIKWSSYFEELNDKACTLNSNLEPADYVRSESQFIPSIKLLDWDKDGENKILAASIYESSNLEFGQIYDLIKNLSQEQKKSYWQAIVGNRTNRRHKPGRGFETSYYTFEIESDYGAFRDLQRHRLLTIQWQCLTPFATPQFPTEIEYVGLNDDWKRAWDSSVQLWTKIFTLVSPQVAQYVLPLMSPVRYLIKLNAREAIHFCELRSSEQGHENYRHIAQEMYKQIGVKAGHHLIANSMKFMDLTKSSKHLRRLSSELKSRGVEIGDHQKTLF